MIIGTLASPIGVHRFDSKLLPTAFSAKCRPWGAAMMTQVIGSRPCTCKPRVAFPPAASLASVGTWEVRHWVVPSFSLPAYLPLKNKFFNSMSFANFTEQKERLFNSLLPQH